MDAWVRKVSLSGFLTFVGCNHGDYPICDDPGLPAPTEGVTWHADVRPIVEANCGNCHTEGGIGPEPFTTYEETAPWADVIASVTEARTMPPWPPASCCRPLQHTLALDPEEIAMLTGWAEAGAPEGDPADYVAPVLPATGLPRVDLSLAMPEPYTPDPKGGTDDTRCFLLDWPVDGVNYVTGLGVRPGVPSQVHHALLVVVGVLAVPELQALDALDDAPGWSCPGGIVWGMTGWVGGWSPGWTAREMPPGTGQKVERGAKLVLTVHYSVTTAAPVEDLTSVDLMLADDVESELSALSVYDPLWLVGGLRIPADDPDVMVSHRSYPLKRKSLVGVNLHMHERGSRGSVGIVHADGSKECLLQIDDWQHEWQGDYLFEEPITLERDDALWVECHWDNRPENQRIVNGIPEPSRTLGWAEDEEMCVAFVTARDL